MVKRVLASLTQYCRDNQRVCIDILVLIGAIVGTGFLLASIEATEAFYKFSREHEELELDDLALTTAISSFYILIFTLRRFFDLKCMMVMAYTDPLIGILNRRRGTFLIQNEIKKSKRKGYVSSVIMFDLDDFKKINDEHGHCKGDFVLQEVCSITQKLIREGDKVIRWGGEEFIVLCPASPLEQASVLAERLRTSIDEHEFSGLTEVTASFGVAEIKYEDQLDSLLSRVDHSLYESKNSGKNKVSSS